MVPSTFLAAAISCNRLRLVTGVQDYKHNQTGMNWTKRSWYVGIYGAIAILGIAGLRSLSPSAEKSNAADSLDFPPSDPLFLNRPSPSPPAMLPDASLSSPGSVISPMPSSPAFPPPRQVPARPSAPSFATLNSQQLDKQLRTYWRYLSELGRPDILIVGSSRALQGVDPIALRQTLTQQGYPGLKIYNFGINGATAQVVEFLLTELLSPAQLPRLILWADGVRAFNSGRIDQTHRRILDSPGYRQLRAGLLPLIPTAAIAETQPICQDIPVDHLTRSLLGKPLPATTPVPDQSFDLCRPILQLLAQAEQTADATFIQHVQRSLGFHPLNNRFSPSEYFQRYPRVPGAYDGDYRRFTLNGTQTQALNRVLTFSQSQGIPVLFVNLPMTQIYLDWTRSTSEKDFRAWMRQYAQTGKLTFYDFGQRWRDRYSYFMDPSHLNRYGAVAVSQELGQTLSRSVLPDLLKLP